MSTPQWEQMHLGTVSLTKTNGEVVKIRSRIADDSGERSAGFQHICPEIIELSSVLFVYERPRMVSFHMNNVHDSLDIGFFDENGELLQVTRMDPYGSINSSKKYYSSDYKFQFALETRAGFFQEQGLDDGTVVLTYH